MKTPPSTPPPTSMPDWLNDCSFQSRQDSLGLTPGILGHHLKKSSAADSFRPDIASGITALGQHGVVSATKQSSGPVVASPTKALSRPSNNHVLSELRTLRQLSSQVFDPQTQRDFLPEMILFGLIGVLCAAWPIMSMLGAMSGRH